MQTSEIMEEEEDVSPRVSLRRNGSFICVAAPFGCDSSNNFSYDKLPEEPLKLTVLKLDGSSFDIQVARNGTVEDLKRAVEETFTNCKISWLHLWGQFCLSYGGQTLLANDNLIATYGIKDCDQLNFVRHVSTVKTQSEGEENPSDEPNTPGYEDAQEGGEEEENHNSENDEDNSSEDENDGGIFTSCQYKLFHLFRGWFSYHKLENTERGAEQKFE